MTFNELIGVFGGNAALLTGLYFLLRELLTTKLKEQQATFEHRLNSKLAAFSHRHSVFSENQAEVLATVYSKLYAVKEEVSNLGCTQNIDEYFVKRPAFDSAFNDAHRYYLVNRFYFTEKLSAAVVKVLHELEGLAQTHQFGRMIDKGGDVAVEHVMTLRKQGDSMHEAINECHTLFNETLSPRG